MKWRQIARAITAGRINEAWCNPETIEAVSRNLGGTPVRCQEEEHLPNGVVFFVLTKPLHLPEVYGMFNFKLEEINVDKAVSGPVDTIREKDKRNESQRGLRQEQF